MAEEKLSPLEPMNKSMDNEETTYKKAKERKNTESHREGQDRLKIQRSRKTTK
jgi:predicted RNA-binding protein